MKRHCGTLDWDGLLQDRPDEKKNEELTTAEIRRLHDAAAEAEALVQGTAAAGSAVTLVRCAGSLEL